jgi:GNAT superfamily N-acetyltransferase
MMANPGTVDTAPFRRLAWDSEHFGFQVGELTDPALDDVGLQAVLTLARGLNYRLAYWPTYSTRVLPQALLSAFGGVHVDDKVTFIRSLPEALSRVEDTAPPGVRITEYPEAPAPEALINLAIRAGEYSRFKVDPRFPREKFRTLYETWIRRSTLRELAAVVLLATGLDETLAGMITASLKDVTATIGLLAVADSFQGRGVGSALINATHSWAAAGGAKQAKVITQLVNRPAYKLYERSGYQQLSVQRIYHFWLE